MKTDLSRNLIFPALLCASLMAASAYATDYGDVSVKIETVTSGSSGSGYSEYRATIINRSTTESHRVTIEMFSGRFAQTLARRGVEIAPSSAATVSLIIPGADYGGAANVLIDGARQDEAVGVDASRASAWVMVPPSANAYFLLVSRDVEESGLMNDAPVAEGFKNAHGEDDVAYLAYKSPMPEWSANWVGYSAFDGVMVTADQLRAAPDAVRSALWRYAECGGSLLIIGAWEIPQQWRSRRVNSIEVEEEEAGVSWRKLSLSLPKTMQSYNVGFGQVTMIDAASVKTLLPEQWKAIKLSWKNSRLTIDKRYRDIVDINKDFPVVESIGIPVRGLFVLMLAFVVVIGPINLIWLARRRKKIWMLWTVPVIALTACLAVTGYALLGEGVSATARVEALTILDESSRRATTIGWTAFYAPIAPREGLHFSYDTELAPVWPNVWLYTGGAADYTIDLSTDQHLDSGWITARVPAYFKFRKSEARRERLTVRRSGGDSISVVNGLGADISALWLADRDGRIYSAREIRAGAETKLSLTGLSGSGNAAGLRELFTDGDWLARMKEVEKNPQRYLAPGSYLAALDASPFVEEGLKSVETRKGRSLVYGVSAEGER